MLAMGMLLIWGGYSISLWGWCLIRDYDVTLGQLVSPVHPYGSGKGQLWPPQQLSTSVIFPGQAAAAASPSASPASGATPKPGAPGVQPPGSYPGHIK
jgi:hypothetical protein